MPRFCVSRATNTCMQCLTSCFGWFCVFDDSRVQACERSEVMMVMTVGPSDSGRLLMIGWLRQQLLHGAGWVLSRLRAGERRGDAAEICAVSRPCRPAPAAGPPMRRGAGRGRCAVQRRHVGSGPRHSRRGACQCCGWAELYPPMCHS